MAGALHNWGEILLTQNLRSDQPMDAVSRWMLITRASVIPMTLISGLIGGLLAVGVSGANWLYWAITMLGLLAAHAANNMINDYFDLEGGVPDFQPGQFVTLGLPDPDPERDGKMVWRAYSIASAPSEASPSPSRAPRRSVANPPRRDPPPPRRADADEAGATRGDAARIAVTRAPRWMDEPSDAYTIFNIQIA